VFLELDATAARRASEHQVAVRHGLGQGGHHGRVAEQVVGTGRAPEGLFGGI